MASVSQSSLHPTTGTSEHEITIVPLSTCSVNGPSVEWILVDPIFKLVTTMVVVSVG